MLRPQPIEAAAQYHVLGFEILLETIQGAFDHPVLFEDNM